MIILLLEDSRTSANAIIKALRAHDHHVEWQRGIVGARSACSGKRFDTYIVDANVQLDDRGGTGDGIEFIRWVRDPSRHPESRIILCTAHASMSAHSTELGCSFVLKHPDIDIGDAIVRRLRVRA